MSKTAFNVTVFVNKMIMHFHKTVLVAIIIIFIKKGKNIENVEVPKKYLAEASFE